MSIEALAMAGADYVECGINLEALERSGWEQTPPHLLADEQSFNIGNEEKGAEILIVKMCSGQQKKKQACTKGLKPLSQTSFKNERFNVLKVCLRKEIPVIISLTFDGHHQDRLQAAADKSQSQFH
uniref:Uncharacterized protein n=1 Tax=Quercus lobata TaxID=97700 RepID=A0A7N2M109_QUELO